MQQHEIYKDKSRFKLLSIVKITLIVKLLGSNDIDVEEASGLYMKSELSCKY